MSAKFKRPKRPCSVQGPKCKGETGGSTGICQSCGMSQFMKRPPSERPFFFTRANGSGGNHPSQDSKS